MCISLFKLNIMTIMLKYIQRSAYHEFDLYLFKFQCNIHSKYILPMKLYMLCKMMSTSIHCKFHTCYDVHVLSHTMETNNDSG